MKPLFLSELEAERTGGRGGRSGRADNDSQEQVSQSFDHDISAPRMIECEREQVEAGR